MRRLLRLFFCLFLLFFPMFDVSAEDTQLSPFTITTIDMPANTVFALSISATGNFTVDWGDEGSIEPTTTITKDNTDVLPISHTYTDGGVHTITISGNATGYHKHPNNGSPNAAISFENNTNVLSVDGSLGTILTKPTDNQYPSFYRMFKNCTNLTTINNKLFTGISGASNYAFSETFMGCKKLAEIPEGLFAEVSLRGTGIFGSTFNGCSSIRSIPENLFKGGTNAQSMFSSTFKGCTSLESIPEKLFENVTMVNGSAFGSTFSGCKNITEIPAGLFAGLNNSNVGEYAFSNTFAGTSITTIPDTLFDGITGTVNKNAFSGTFASCKELTTIPIGLFKNIKTLNGTHVFGGTFSYSSKLATVTLSDGTTVNYIPREFFNSELDISSQYTFNDNSGTIKMFSGTELATTCPGGTIKMDELSEYLGKAVCRVGSACPAGQYFFVDAGECAQCVENFYCLGGLFDPELNESQGAVECATLADGFYPNSAPGADAETDCFTNTLSGKYVETANATSATNCVAGTAKAEHTVNYGETSSCDVCGENQYSDAGASSCTACATEFGYANTGDDVESHAGEKSCKALCDAGYYVATPGTACVEVGAGYYGAGGEVLFGDVSEERGQCDANLTTIGYGFGANEAEDCGRPFHAGDTVVYLRSAPRTLPALNVRIDEDTVLYGTMSTDISGRIKIKNGETIYSVVDDYQ